jgi:hypothetical protein
VVIANYTASLPSVSSVVVMMEQERCVIHPARIARYLSLQSIYADQLLSFGLCTQRAQMLKSPLRNTPPSQQKGFCFHVLFFTVCNCLFQTSAFFRGFVHGLRSQRRQLAALSCVQGVLVSVFCLSSSRQGFVFSLCFLRPRLSHLLRAAVARNRRRRLSQSGMQLQVSHQMNH